MIGGVTSPYFLFKNQILNIMKPRVSPIDKKILQCIANILTEKPTLVKLGKSMFDAQFHALLSIYGISNVMLDKEIDFLLECGYLDVIDSTDKYRGNSTHYVLTSKGAAAI